ncbi:MAG: hypothetical protein LBG45_02905, partial [Dysgonamonadaceae bacterium]|nr:hypothetical protein [Dysgonamonadaceae bacterium]
MKRKLFTLLLAMGLLTAFQANAQLEMRFLADTSGLAKTSSPKSGLTKEEFRYDSFPHVKKAGLFNWLSYSEGKISLNRGSLDSCITAQDSIRIQKELLADKASIFTVNFSGTDSTQFRITPKGGTDDVQLNHRNGSTGLFRILKLANGREAESPKDGVLANLFRPSDQKDTLAGYLAYVPDPTKIKLDTLDVSVGLVGWNKKTEELSIKYFNEFAFYADTLPLMLQSFQFASEKPDDFDPGRLYRTDSFPYFQIYAGGNTLIRSSKNHSDDTGWHEGGKATNWGHRNPQNGHQANLNDTCVYAWLDIKFSGDSAAIILPGYGKQKGVKEELIDTTAIVHLDTLVNIAHRFSLKFDSKEIVNTATTKWDIDSVKPWKEVGGVTNTEGGDSVMYLKKDGNQLVFTVKTKNDKKETDWTAGYPTPFKWVDASDKNKEKYVYYSVDTTFMALLDSAYVHEFEKEGDEKFLPYDSVGARYVYKYNDDSWRPLFVRADSVNAETEKAKKYEYITVDRLEKEKLYGEALTPKVILPELAPKYISKEKDKISLVDDEERSATFKITLADTILNTKGGWFYCSEFGGQLYTNKKKKFEIEDSVQVFNISDGNGHLLTVSDHHGFVEPLRNSLAWADTLDNEESKLAVRQLFAIVRDYEDSTYTFLPVAAPKWNNNEKEDTLSFNLAIGRENKDGQLVSLEGAWHLESSLSYKLVVADSSSKTEPLKFKLTSPFQPWKKLASDYVAIKKVSTGKYYRGYSNDGTGTDTVTVNDIAAQWTVEPDKENTWKFTPVFKDAEKPSTVPFVTKTVRASSKEGDDNVYLEWGEGNDIKKDTVVIETSHGPDAFNLYSGFDFDWDGKEKGLVTIVSGEKYLAHNDKNEVSYVRGTADDSPTITIHRGEENEKLITTNGDESYPVRYYRFSYKAKDNKEYYLKAEGTQIRWEAGNGSDETHRFYLPTAHAEGTVYLHDHAGHLLQVSRDGSKLSLGDETVYSTINAINDATEDDPATLQWTITKKGDIKDTWAVVDSTLFDEDGTATGVLVIGEEGKTFIGVDGNKGVLSNKTDESVVLKLIQTTTLDPQSIVAYSPLRATAETDVPVGYKIIHGDLYLTDEDDDATFSAEANTSEKQTFAFKNNEEDDGFAIVLFSDENRFLSSAGLNLKFSNTDKLSFTWGKAED